MDRKLKDTDSAIPDPWLPRKDLAAYVISAIVLVLELPVLAVLALGALVARAAAAAAGVLRPPRSEKIGT